MRRISPTWPSGQDDYPKPFDVTKMADDIEADIAGMINDIPREPTPVPPLSYVTDHPEVNEIGRLSSAAIAGEHEAVAKTVEGLAEDLKRLNGECALAVMEAVESYQKVTLAFKAAIASCSEVATRYRSRAAELHKTIQQYSMVADSARKTCDALQAKIDTPAAATEEERHETQTDTL